MASLDEDGSYIGYGAACDEEEGVDEADECSAGTHQTTRCSGKVQKTHGLSLHPYGRPAGMSNGSINGRAHPKGRYKRGYESDESFPNRRPVFGGSATPYSVSGYRDCSYSDTACSVNFDLCCVVLCCVLSNRRFLVGAGGERDVASIAALLQVAPQSRRVAL